MCFFLLAALEAQETETTKPASVTQHPAVATAKSVKNTSIATSVVDDDSDDGDPNCTNVDIRNNPSRLALIENCTVINGFLQMVLMDRVPAEAFAQYNLSKLREITGYMLLFRVVNLGTLRNLFPNLTVIRGQQLIGNFALVIYDMGSMFELGLKSLVAIQRGFVYTLHCPLLCHLDTIDWAAMTGQDNSTKNHNSLETPKAACNSAEVCRGCDQNYCWGSTSCQKFDTGYNFNGKMKCHPQCLAGCTGTSNTACKVCRGLKQGNRCVEQCSPDRLQFRHTNRCITQESCLKRGGLLHMNECVIECPAGYSPTNVDQDVADFQVHRCFPCKNRCPKVCDSAEIMYLSDMDRVRGCTVINGTLHIRLKEDHPNLLEELRIGLGDIEEIMGRLKVFRSNFISSLEFLASLEIIHGQDTTDNANFALMVYENSNLQRLWNFEYKTSLHILSGGMYFRNNALLCNTHIELLRKVTEYDNSTDTIEWRSNGYMQACHVEHFRARAEVLSSRNVTVYWTKYQGKTHHQLLGYLIYYIRTNVDKSPYEERDMCSKFGWKTRYVPLENVTVQGIYYAFNLTRLKPFTRYGVYVRTYFNESTNSSTDRVGLSNMHYFKTAKDRPTSPLRVRTVRKTDGSITLTWHLLPSEQEMVYLYQVDVFIEPDERAKFDQRNFCTHPHVPPGSREVHDDGSVDSEACSKEFCCDLLEEEDEEDAENDAEVTSPDGFFGGDGHQSIVGEDESSHGRRKKRSTRKSPRLTPLALDEFEKSMLSLLANADEDHGQRHARRMRRDAEVEFVNRIASRKFTTDNYEYTVTGLEPYKYYIFQLFACSEDDLDYCSAYSLYADRTAPSPSFDRLNVTIATGQPVAGVEGNETKLSSSTAVKTTSNDRIVLHFPEPAEVNGLTVAYRVEIEYINGTTVQRWDHCFTRLEHEQRQHLYTIAPAPPGEYLIRAQLISLAGPGQFTEWMLVRVLAPPTVDGSSVFDDRSLRNGLIALAVLLVILAVSGVAAVVLWRRRQQATGKRDDKILLADNDGNEINLDDGFVNCALK
uniref:receptor protein-tyrosine kinase n=1 Tax=Anopheles atroparvus TaxID=41427 RepID=A0A182J7Y1_ANOAO